MARIGPVVLQIAGDAFIQSTRILAIIWTGTTTAADTASLHCPSTGNLIWTSQTNVANTYQGANYGPKGIHAPHGFKLSQISAGRVLVYLMED